jgi:hypothetical protein
MIIASCPAAVMPARLMTCSCSSDDVQQESHHTDRPPEAARPWPRLVGDPSRPSPPAGTVFAVPPHSEHGSDVKGADVDAARSCAAGGAVDRQLRQLHVQSFSADRRGQRRCVARGAPLRDRLGFARPAHRARGHARSCASAVQEPRIACTHDRSDCHASAPLTAPCCEAAALRGRQAACMTQACGGMGRR